MDVFDDWEYKQGRRGRFRRLGVEKRHLDGRFRRLGDQNGRFRRLGDRKRLPIVQIVHEAHQMTPNREKRPHLEGPGHRRKRGLNCPWSERANLTPTRQVSVFTRAQLVIK